MAAFDRAAQALAAATAATASLVELDLVVIGGGAQAEDLLFPPAAPPSQTYAALRFTHGLEVSPSQLAMDAGLVGAAAVAASRRRVQPGTSTPVSELHSTTV